MSVFSNSYRSFHELAREQEEGIDYRRCIRDQGSSLAIVVPHGGGIEVGTSEIARALAGDTYTLYCFEGIKHSGNHLLHIPSTHFDDPLCLKLLDGASRVLSLHGCAGKRPLIHVGGRHKGWKKQILSTLTAHHFPVVEAVHKYPGTHPENICNVHPSGGVQLELSTGFRERCFQGLSRAKRQFTTPFFERFVSVLQTSLAP
jgi:phage replication-related protein YjqB (UPF0714/DUF867 family)